MNRSVVPEVADYSIDYQSGSEHPHSIGSAVHRSRSSLSNVGGVVAFISQRP